MAWNILKPSVHPHVRHRYLYFRDLNQHKALVSQIRKLINFSRVRISTKLVIFIIFPSFQNGSMHSSAVFNVLLYTLLD